MEGRVAVVTGASSGIGRAAALALAREGASLGLMALPGGELEEIADECRSAGVQAVALPAEVGDPQAVADAFEKAAKIGPVDAVFNNAGISIVTSITDTTDEQWQRLLRTNLTGSFNVARQAARVLLPQRRGAIVNTASELALTGEAGYAPYSATKGGVLSMTRAMAAELAPHGIRVNAICPGTVDTPMLQAEFETADDPPAARAEAERSVALGRFGRPEEIAATVTFLLSDEAAYITGSHYLVDGGRTNCFPVGALAPPPAASRPTR